MKLSSGILLPQAECRAIARIQTAAPFPVRAVAYDPPRVTRRACPAAYAPPRMPRRACPAAHAPPRVRRFVCEMKQT